VKSGQLFDPAKRPLLCSCYPTLLAPLRRIFVPAMACIRCRRYASVYLTLYVILIGGYRTASSFPPFTCSPRCSGRASVLKEENERGSNMPYWACCGLLFVVASYFSPCFASILRGRKKTKRGAASLAPPLQGTSWTNQRQSCWGDQRTTAFFVVVERKR